MNGLQEYPQMVYEILFVCVYISHSFFQILKESKFLKGILKLTNTKKVKNHFPRCIRDFFEDFFKVMPINASFKDYCRSTRVSLSHFFLNISGLVEMVYYSFFFSCYLGNYLGNLDQNQG